MMSEPGSFAHTTLTQRWPAVIKQAIATNDFSPDILHNLEILEHDLLAGKVRLLTDEAADQNAWSQYLTPYVGHSWLEVPWFFAEVYFYRRFLEATQYFQAGKWQGIDPFAPQKQANLKTALQTLQAQAQLKSQQLAPAETSLEQLQTLFYRSLWGNQADLSLKPGVENLPQAATPENGSNFRQDFLLIDDTSRLLNGFRNGTFSRVDIIADNAGAELISDLFLMDFLLTQEFTQSLCLHVKAHPTFVSDATCADVDQTLEALVHGDADSRAIALRIRDALRVGKIHLKAEPFWTDPLVFWQMPADLRQALAQVPLIILKGDANYRRLLGDCHWSFTQSFEAVTRYFPTSLVVLRTLKSEVITGLQSHQLQQLAIVDPHWLTNGEWGVIQANCCPDDSPDDSEVC